MEFEIDRAKWRMGTLCDGAGCKCPLGFFYSALGFSDASLEQRSNYPFAPGDPDANATADFGMSVWWANDGPCTEEDREERVTGIFKEHGHTATWVGEYL